MTAYIKTTFGTYFYIVLANITGIKVDGDSSTVATTNGVWYTVDSKTALALRDLIGGVVWLAD